MFSVGHVSYRYGQSNALYDDAQLVGRVTVVVVRQILHELSQVYFWLGLLLPKDTQLLKNRTREDTFRKNYQSGKVLKRQNDF